jgi:hypothetical protein
MPRWAEEDESWDDDAQSGDDDAYFDDDETDDDSETIPCPYCHRPIHEDSERCPHCEQYISSVDAPSRKPWWMVVGVIVCLYLVYRWFVR